MAMEVECSRRRGDDVRTAIADANEVAAHYGHAVWRIYWLRLSAELTGDALDAERLDERIMELAQSTDDPTLQRQIFQHWAPRPQ